MVVFETKRLRIRLANSLDGEMYFTLWTNPRVMVYVGFPNGLPITREEVDQIIQEQDSSSVFNRLLVIELKDGDQAIGECKMILPDDDGISRTDVKLLPAFWGRRYGQEVKRGLVAYLFQSTTSKAVEATPSINNIASIKMQEAVGGVRVGEGVFNFPESKRDYTIPVPHYVYHVFREDWQIDEAPNT